MGTAAGRSLTVTRARMGAWWMRLAVLGVLIAAVATVLVTNSLLTDRFTAATKNRADLRLALYTGNVLSELRRNAIVPQLLSRDPTLIGH